MVLATVASAACQVVGPAPNPPRPEQDDAVVVPSASDEEQASRPNLLDRLGIDWNAVPTTPIPESFDQGGALAASTQGSAEAKSGSDSAETIEDEGGNVVVAPIPFVSPTIGYGLALGGAYLVKLDPKSPPSTIGVGALYSENNSYGGGLFFKGFFAEDRVRVTAGIVATRLNFDLRVADQDIALRENVLAFGFEVLIRSFERVFIGPQLIVSGIDTDVVRSSDIGVIPDDELEAFNLGVGLRAQRDTRDSTFYPRTGSFADAQLRVFNESLGSDFDYQVLPAAYNHYLSPSSRDVVALRVSTRLAFGDVPFYGQSFVGAGPDLRGYVVGTVQDDALAAVQGEYRRELYGRLGAVAFAGVGAVAPTLGDVFDAETLPSAGFGARFTLEEKNHVNLRIDVAWGRDQSAVYLAVGEAF